jgi:peptide deformylase
MFEIMYRCRGVGLAGNQAGLSRRIVVANIEADPERKDLEMVIINPRILWRSPETVREEEGCLSLPGLRANITRAAAVRVEYLTLTGERVTEEAEGFRAKMFQHECDHLEGLLILDKMSEADRRFHAPLLRDLEERYRSRPGTGE